ncbi:PhzF family phenazine biosynthesis protein [Streptomyces litchfieldiae]|uniref:PhzF family phenazine biosynthesis protein n=1 Tax=Streptomyces litchfieldiae TaxID=3075543 RepID=A0ABU2MNJ2_9ACTN|nr:PhzF family phenazine biosynthesis protein [Streptomyces sp. DSM 44938]MDT0343188.1 PhzF family phenazine biosynthesis protein [Streptomyces sp. DSM 44938]
MNHTFFIADVFTERAFGGNQLAVLPDARGLSTDQMQDIAREFGFSETSFVLPPEDPAHTARVRIFTPRAELPFAGHPTVGTAAVLTARRGVAGPRLLFEEGVGVVAVDVSGSHARLTLTAPYETPGHAPDRAAVAAALSLSGTDILDCWFGGVGLRFCYVRLTGPEAVDRAVPRGTLGDAWADTLYVFAGEHRDGGRVYSRCLIPDHPEDPATGSASAGLVAALWHHEPHPDGTRTLRVEQGVAMGRPSDIEATATVENGRLASVSVGGHSVIVAEGTLSVPESA